jgi:MFS family permease
VILAALTYTYVNHDVRALLPLGLGLLFAAIADRGISLRRRITSMAGATIGIAFGTALGCAVSANQFLHVAAAGFVGLFCGLIGVASIAAMTTGILTLVIFAIFSGSPIDLLDWKTNTLLMLLGACIMITTVVVEFGIRLLTKTIPESADKSYGKTFWDRSKVHFHWNDSFILHSIRLAIVIAIATTLEELLAFPHSYWIPMSVAWISKPDLDGTVDKVARRVIGTLFGAAIAGTLIATTPFSSAFSLIMVCVASYFVLAFLIPNYAVTTAGITVFVFFLFRIVGFPMAGSITARVLSTLIAAALVLTAVRIGPQPRQLTAPAP